MARRVHWWQYRGCRTISNTPYYIIVGELGIAIALALLPRLLRAGRVSTAIGAGVVGGVAIPVCYLVAFSITDH
jgi:hypothetical protein